MIAPEDINKIDIVKPNVEAIELFNGMTEEVVEAVPGVVLVVNMKKDENTIKNNMDIHNVLKDNIYLSDHYKTVVDVGNRNVGQDSYSSSSASFSTNDNFHNSKDDRSNILANVIVDPTIDNQDSEVKKKVVPAGTRVMLVGDELPDVQQPADVPRASHASSVYNELLKGIMKTTNVVNKNCNIIDRGGSDGSNIVDSHDDSAQSQPQSQHNHYNAVLKLGPKARKRFLILKYSLPKQQQQHMKLTRHLKVEIIRECKSIVDLDCWSDEENHLFDLPDDDDVEEEKEEEEIGSEGKNKILRLSRAQYNNPLIDESRHRGRAQYQDRSSTSFSPTTSTATTVFVSLKPSDIVQDDHDELIRNAVTILYRYKRAQLKKAQSKNKSTTLQKLRVISTFMLR